MARRFVKETFRFVQDTPGAVYEDIVCEDCVFESASLGKGTRSPSCRTILRRVRASGCSGGGDVGPVLLDDVVISGLRSPGGLWVRGALYKHVVLEGKIGRVSLTADYAINNAAAVQAEFDGAARAFYESVDWALDIRNARFVELDWRSNVPARLVRRDPLTQSVVTRESVRKDLWRQLPLHPVQAIMLDMFAKSTLPDMVLAAPRAASSFRQELAGLEVLRAAGVTEPESS